MKQLVILLPFVLVLAGCQRAKVRTIPDPLPESLEWAEHDLGAGSFLGLETRENDSGSLDDLFFDPGVKVARVVENSPARIAGIREGDVVLKLDETELFDPQTLEALLAETEPGTAISLAVRRGDTVREVPVTVQARGGAEASKARELYLVDISRSRAGWATAPGGVRLVTSQYKGPFRKIPIGSVVTEIDDERVHSARGLIKLLESNDPGEKVTVHYVDEKGRPRKRKVRLIDVPTRVTKTSVPILFHYNAEADGSGTKFELIDLWVISLFKYERLEKERNWSILSLFEFSSGEGELTR